MNKVVSLLFGNNKQQSFEQIVEPYLNLMFKVAYQYTGNTEDAEDLVQEVLAELFKNLTKLQQAEKTKAWIMRCLYNKFVDQYRQQKSRPLIDSLDDEQQIPLTQATPEHELLLTHQQVLAGLSQLNSNQRALVTMHDINGYTLVELAEIMQKPVGTLKSDLHRARAKLKILFNLQPSDIQSRHCM
ncbi:sigma-24 FecI-like protein [Catenovulum agarivorans DS-2]|uniref:Sigma-24 FecI-like protein n=1 Tax=Catenovulum agarivorans DS-2 TaxID=1328313 RepID=W7QWK4_9ALTE|nr:RNA polymerase sigma factor [Catenovulum agarivorans]EWH12113.1 sigma-24 FecI-like protein [Catenovulum agarivorans DS-2]